MNALLWVARSGGRWRDLPEHFGRYPAVKRRDYRWIQQGILDAIFPALASDADMEWLMIDSTIVRAHQSRRGAQGQRRAHAQGLGRSRGGLTTKIRTASDALGNPVRLIAGPSQQHGMSCACRLVDSLKTKATIGYKGYDANTLGAKIIQQGSHPAQAQPQFPRTYDKERNLIEHLFAKLIKFRRIATRYDKHLVNSIGFVKLAAIVISLR